MREYFSHDYHARHDPKLQKLLRVMGLEGIGLFWCITEFCYEQGGRILDSECDSIAFDLRTECERIRTVLNNFGLFDFDGTAYTSQSITNRLNHRNDISEKARISAEKRWKNAKALPTQCEGNALKEIKEKEIKEKKKKEDIQPDKPVDPRYKAFISVFDNAWKANREGNPAYTKEAGAQLKAMLIRQPTAIEDSFTLVCDNCLKDPFHAKNFSLIYVSTHYETLLNLKKGVLNGGYDKNSGSGGRYIAKFEQGAEAKYANL